MTITIDHIEDTLPDAPFPLHDDRNTPYLTFMKLKDITAWDVITLRIPEKWKHGQDANGMWRCAEEGAESGVLWLDWDLFTPDTDENTIPDADLKDLANALAQRDDKPYSHRNIMPWRKDWIIALRFCESDNLVVPLRHYVWYRLAPMPHNQVMVLHFTFVTPDETADHPQFTDLINFFSEEIGDALLMLPDHPENWEKRAAALRAQKPPENATA
jgi:hypothetical protein